MASEIDPTYPTEGTATTASVRNNFTAAKTEIEELQDALLIIEAELTAWQTAYPIGSIYINTGTANPNTFMPWATWTPFATGRVLVGLASGEAEFDTLGETGGSKTHTLTTGEIPSHTHTQDAHTHTQNSHNHTQDAHTHTQNSHNHTQDAHTHTQNSHDHNTQVHGGGATNNTTGHGITGTSVAGALRNLNDPTTGTTATNQNTTATNQATTATNQNTTATNQATTATNQNTTATNQNTGGSGSHNNLQPYIVVKFWERTA